MSDWVYKNIDFVIGFLGLAILWIPIFHEVKHEKRVHPTEAKNIFIKLWRKLPRPTEWGWVFITCVIALFFVSNKKSEKDEREKSAFQNQVTNGQKDIKIATEKEAAASAAYTKKLEDFGAGLIRRDTIFMQQLDKWGLRMQDNVIVSKEDPFVSSPLNTPPATFHQSNDTFYFAATIANTGGAGTKVNGHLSIMIERKGINYAFKAIERLDINLPKQSKYATDTGNIAHFIYNPKTDKVYIILLGFYYNNLQKKQSINLVYNLSPPQNTWLVSSNAPTIIENLKNAISISQLPK